MSEYKKQLDFLKKLADETALTRISRMLSPYAKGKQPMIRPQNDWVLVEPVTETKRGTLFIPEMAREGETYQVGKVKALPPRGEADLHFNIDCTVGDLVVYDTRATVKATANGEELTLTRARDIAAVIAGD